MNITIIGLGRIGTSVGLALAARTDKIQRLGHDIFPETARLAKQLGAVDNISFNLPDSVRQADIVLLALPLDQIEETLVQIRPDLKEGVLVLETAPAKEQIMAWMHAHLPPHGTYIGLLPIIHARYLLLDEMGPEAARADLFEGCLVGVSAPPDTSETAVETALVLIELLGSRPLFIDHAEADGIMAALHLLPQLASAGLLGALSIQPGWQENRKLGGSPFARAGDVLTTGDTPEALAQAAMASKTSTLRLVDDLLAEMHNLRGLIEAEDLTGLAGKLGQSARSQAEWSARRMMNDWEIKQDAAEERTASWRDRLSGWFGSGTPGRGS